MFFKRSKLVNMFNLFCQSLKYVQIYEPDVERIHESYVVYGHIYSFIERKRFDNM